MEHFLVGNGLPMRVCGNAGSNQSRVWEVGLEETPQEASRWRWEGLELEQKHLG